MRAPAGGPVREPSRLPHQQLRRQISRQVVALFNDPARNERPVRRTPHGLFGPASIAWRVHGDVGTMMIGGVASLLLQMLHPGVLAGVWDHSAFRTDMHGRLRGTARFIATTTYDTRPAAEAAIARVRAIHTHVHGHLPDGTPYAASDPRLLAWVHVTETTSFLDAWRRYAEPRMTLADQNRYLDEMAQIGEALGADPVPRSRPQARALIEALRPELVSDARTREVAHLLRGQADTRSGDALRGLLMQAAADLLPGWARAMHPDLSAHLPPVLVRAGAAGIAGTLRWALRPA